MASFERMTSERVAELIRLQAERACANGHKPGQMVEAVEVNVIRRNPETGRKEFGLLDMNAGRPRPRSDRFAITSHGSCNIYERSNQTNGERFRRLPC